MMRSALFGLGVIFGIFYSPTTHAFPELIRHGYINCSTCHIAPNGGGTLTDYGRGLSKEILSTWGFENEEKPLFGLIHLPEWLKLSGDMRAIQTYLNSPRVEQARFLIMQADLEAAATVGKFTADATFGPQAESSFNRAGGSVFSRRHFLMYRHSDEIAVRLGRFYPAYGVNFADHTIATRRLLGFEEGGETYNLEASWAGDTHDFFLTAVVGRPESASLNKDSGVALRSALALGDSYKLGLSYFWGTRENASRHLFGPYALLGITPDWFILFEAGTQAAITSGVSQWTLVDYFRVNYEPLRGLHIFATHEILGWNLSQTTSSLGQAYGLGMQWFPRPHWEFLAIAQQRRLMGTTGYSDFAWLLFHFYL